MAVHSSRITFIVTSAIGGIVVSMLVLAPIGCPKQKSADPGATLRRAILDGDVAEIERLVRAGISPNVRIATDRFLWSRPLHLAVGADHSPRHPGTRRKELPTVKCLLKLGADPNARDCWGQTVLMKHPCLSRECLELLCEAGADINARDSEGRTVLHNLGAYCDPEDVAELVPVLIARGGDVNAQNALGETPLHVALRRHMPDDEVIELLLSNGADPSIIDANGVSARELLLARGFENREK